MLVLSRKKGERVHIGDDVIITLVDVDRGKCRIGVEAPRNVAIYRDEIYRGIEAGKLPVAKPAANSSRRIKIDAARFEQLRRYLDHDARSHIQAHGRWTLDIGKLEAALDAAGIDVEDWTQS